MAGRYVHPLPGAKAGRTDEGVDFKPRRGEPIRAIGDAVVAFVGHYRGFGTYVAYRLTSGRLKGTVIYLAEGIDLKVKVGQRVRAGQVVATATGASGGIEMGFAQASGSYLPLANASYSEGQVTDAGRRFARLLTVLGGKPGDVPSSYGGLGTPAAATADSAAQTLPPLQEPQLASTPPDPQGTLPQVYAPGSVPASGGAIEPQQVAETWRLIASQPLSSTDSRLHADSASLAAGG